MSYEYYVTHPEYKNYFDTLPEPVKKEIARSGVEFSTLGELKQCAEYYLEQRHK